MRRLKVGLLNKLKGREQDEMAGSSEVSNGHDDLAKYHCEAGRQLMQDGLYTEALSEFQQASKGSRCAEAHYHMGVIYGYLSHPNKAIKHYEQATSIDPGYFVAFSDLGTAYGNSGRYIEAIRALMRAIRLKPDYAEAHNNLGVVYYNSGCYAEGIKACQKAIRINPDYPNAYYALGRIYIDLRDKELAFDALSTLKNLDQNLADQLLAEIQREFNL